MKTPDWFVFKDFLDALPQKEKQHLLSFLTEDEKDDILNTPALPFHPSHGLSPIKERLHHIHYTWFIAFLDKISDSDKYLFIATLNKEQQQYLYHHFDLSRHVDSLTDLGTEFLTQKLYTYLIKDYKVILPKECLPEDPLNNLLSLSREQLLDVVDFLSLHDLSLELKTVINSSHLIKIESILSKIQKKYLYELRKKIEPIAFKPMGLHYWNGDESILKKILHQRGLNRLSKALSLSDHSLLWHLTHKLDMGRASIVKTLFKELKNKKAHTILVSQVCELLGTV